MRLPAHWQNVRLGDVLEKQPNGKVIQQGWSPQCLPVPAEPGDWGVLKTTAIQPGRFVPEENKALPSHLAARPSIEVESGDLLITCAGPRARCGVPALVRTARSRLMMSGKMYRLRPGPGVLESYLELWLLSPEAQSRIDAMKTGISDSGLNLTHSRFVQLPVPVTDLDEQRRIVEIIEDHFSRLDAADAEIQQSVRRVATLDDQVIRRALLGDGAPATVTPELQDCGTNDSIVCSLPEGWRWKRLEDIATVVGGVTKDIRKQNDPAYVEVPYLRVANVQRGSLNLDHVATIRVPAAKAAALELQVGDVLLNEGGDRDKLARGWVWEGQIAQCIHQNHVFRARLLPGHDPFFVSMTANTFGALWAELNGKQSTNLASISLTKIKQMPVIVPPLEQAQGAVRRVREMSDSTARLQECLAAAATRSMALRRSLLAAAFSGRLTGSASDADRIEELASAAPPGAD